jgi:peptidoglycan hydrolase-like protein with peptidoglycan-binding domain
MQIVGRKFTHDEFRAYLGSLVIPPWCRFITVHNTSAPDVALYNKWTQKPGWQPEQWLKNLTSYYSGMGWHGTPHLFIPPVDDQILVLNDLRYPGVHTPSWNQFSMGVETVGEFEQEQPPPATLGNLTVALAALHEKLGLTPLPYVLGEKGLHFHKEDRRTTHKTCPGHFLDKGRLVAAVARVMDGNAPSAPDVEPSAHVHIPVAAQEADTAGMSVQELTSVKWLQLMLNAWSTRRKPVAFVQLSVNGVRDNTTMEATRTFQKALGLTVDGLAGPVTRSTLKKELAS